MRPRHFWILAETLRPAAAKPGRISPDDRKAIIDMLKGNDNGGFW
jgi:hypothetical protein